MSKLWPTSSCPLLIPEIAHIFCEFVDDKDLLSVALCCTVFYHVASCRLWRTLHPRSHMTLRKIKNTLDGRSRNKRSCFQYNHLVWQFCWSDVTSHMFERQFFNSFQFPNLLHLEFSYAAAQDQAVAHMISASPHLRYVDLSHCYCLSTEAIMPLLSTPENRLHTLILYGCGKISQNALVTLIRRHSKSLRCLKLTDINDEVLTAIQDCTIEDLGLEHCSNLSAEALDKFFGQAQQTQPLTRLRMRDIHHLTTDHMEAIAKTSPRLQYFDLSECSRVADRGFMQLARHCTDLQHLMLAYQVGVTDLALQLFMRNCRRLKHVDLSGCRLLTDEAFRTSLNEGAEALESLNISGLEELSSEIIQELLLRLPNIQEISLGVAYDLTDAIHLLRQVNADQVIFYIDVDKCHTICRI
ncbi:hypothetical protein EC973_003341 [Apophysomyces ossiformis]|uniref:F-box/LRR-repeat protein 15-like leucin rich repeat domain-containing protein n=1 Tax=Apophysomyces ossiformis TaxID=679940 RepID=A0A8H7BZS9_9FUNG|nr:hypothetical protein EC973_003341 [Apophysomyces ossiformis]